MKIDNCILCYLTISYRTFNLDNPIPLFGTTWPLGKYRLLQDQRTSDNHLRYGVALLALE